MTSKALRHNEVGVFALGGLGEIGKNMYCIEYQDELIIIDAGVKFPEEHLLGIDYVIPDYKYLKDNEGKIKGLFITHGHEDHIGGIPFLLKQVKIPKIYGPKLAIGLINKKLEEHRLTKAVKIQDFSSNNKFKFNNFEITFFRTNHSIPDSFGIAVKTPVGTIIHTGDFKFDFTPIGPRTEFNKMTRLGEKRVLCLLSDSTNSELPEFTTSERRVSESMRNLFTKVTGRVIIATFASNIYRVQQIIEASLATNRKVAVFGRSMENTLNVGRELGYIKCPDDTFVSANELKLLKNDEITILCTGSQGEPLAALSRIANGTHRQITIQPGDTVIFSSSPIPGNAQSVGNTINQLFRAGAEVITNNPLTDTHTSGHAGQEELKLMLQLIRPKYFMPVHGEYRMQKIHAHLAEQCGIPERNCFVVNNGQVVAFSEKGARIAGSIPSGTVYIDGSGIGDIGNIVIKDRKILSNDGIVVSVLSIDFSKKKLIKLPTIVSRGFIYMKENEKLVNELQVTSKEFTEKLLSKNPQISIINIKNELSDYLSQYIEDKTQRKPMVLPVVMNVKKGTIAR